MVFPTPSPGRELGIFSPIRGSCGHHGDSSTFPPPQLDRATVRLQKNNHTETEGSLGSVQDPSGGVDPITVEKGLAGYLAHDQYN